jgi:hypothetical protein
MGASGLERTNTRNDIIVVVDTDNIRWVQRVKLVDLTSILNVDFPAEALPENPSAQLKHLVEKP